jgi:hypothetical protein
MATLKLNSQTVVTESGGTLTAPALNVTTGTLGSSVTLPSSLSSCIKLYSNDVSGVASFSVDGYFDDTKYAFYEMHLQDVKMTDGTTGQGMAGRVNVGGTAKTSHDYWTSGHGAYNSDGVSNVMTRADVDGNNSLFFMDHTWLLGGTGNVPRTANYIIKFPKPQSTSRYFQCIIESYGNSHNAVNTYDSWSGFTHLSVVDTSAISGFTFLQTSGTSNVLQASVILYGYRK